MANVGDFDFYCEEAISGKTRVDKLYESENVLAFYHTKPAYEIHIVIVPKKHIHDILDLNKSDEKIVFEIIEAAKQLTGSLDLEKGVRFITNVGKFQDTPHLHFHLVCGEKKSSD